MDIITQLITDKFLADQEFSVRMNRVRVGGDMTMKGYKEFLMGIIKHSYDIEQAWIENSLGKSDTNDSLRSDSRYVFMPVYTVKAETSSKMQPTMTFRIVSDMTGDPQSTDEELLKRVSDFREKVETIYTTMP